MSAPTPPLTFVLAPAAALEAETLCREELERVQALGVGRAAALRIFAAGRQPLPAPADLPLDGRLGGPGPGGSSGLRCICDATIPDFEPARLWLGVYGPADADGERWQQVDRFPLSDAANETCWFYPTHDGAFLSWQRNLAVQLAPARIVDPPPGLPAAYDRGQIAVLWSLLADDTTLTCVGLTYAGRRIDWPPGPITWQPTATWRSFVVDSRAETPLTVEQCWVTPQDLPVAAPSSA